MNTTTNNNSSNKVFNKNGKAGMDKALSLFADMMIEKIESIQQDWRKPWFTEGTVHWPQNLNGREYNGMNAMMLMMHCEKQGYEHPIFCTFDRVMSFNYTTSPDGQRVRFTKEDGTKLPMLSVKKGEKSFPVFIVTFTVVGQDGKTKMRYEDYKRLSQDERKDYRVYPALKVYYVFNIAQTNMKEVRPEYYKKLISGCTAETPTLNSEDFSFRPMDRLLEQQQWICPINIKHQDDAYYSMSSGSITVPEKKQFVDGEAFYGCVLHEMAHSTGSNKYLNRKHEYAVEELVAELTAALCANRYGMEKHINDDSVAYVKAWLGSLRKSPEFIRTILIDVKKASYIITNKIDSMKEVPEA